MLSWVFQKLIMNICDYTLVHKNIIEEADYLHCAVPCSCYAMLCYALAMLCCAMLVLCSCYAMLCCAVLCRAVLCCAVLCCAVLCCAVLCWAVLCCAKPYFVMQDLTWIILNLSILRVR
jgi:hypothetical protein